jgi:transcriptional regulator with XRE-family HTH domain
MSQLELASRPAVSTRHLSFIETGRSRPSREMIPHLAQRLELPLRERNRVLLAGGFAPAYPEHALEDLEMRLVRDALERFLAAHEPYPALVIDRHWTIVAFNQAVGLLTRGIAAELLEPPANALRIALHPDGMAPRIRNHRP